MRVYRGGNDSVFLLDKREGRGMFKVLNNQFIIIKRFLKPKLHHLTHLFFSYMFYKDGLRKIIFLNSIK